MIVRSRGSSAIVALAVWIACLALATSLPAPAAAQDLKIGFIRSSAILDQYEGARAAVATLNGDIEAWNQEAQTRMRELDALRRELGAQAPMLSDQVRREKEQEYQRKSAAYDQYVQSIWGPQGLVASRNEELLRGVVEKIQRAARKIASEQGFTFILDASDGNLIYGDTTYDLTDQVLEILKTPE
ncbi:MAG: OmpH family outer membrane protein [Candidatus Eisenbacteria bacterium]|nr:OmpH family outer membrane protein [Candidatus Eisenbacteria bacterium]